MGLHCNSIKKRLDMCLLCTYNFAAQDLFVQFKTVCSYTYPDIPKNLRFKILIFLFCCTSVLCAQKNHLNETGFLSTKNIQFD